MQKKIKNVTIMLDCPLLVSEETCCTFSEATTPMFIAFQYPTPYCLIFSLYCSVPKIPVCPTAFGHRIQTSMFFQLIWPTNLCPLRTWKSTDRSQLVTNDKTHNDRWQHFQIGTINFSDSCLWLIRFEQYAPAWSHVCSF